MIGETIAHNRITQDLDRDQQRFLKGAPCMPATSASTAKSTAPPNVPDGSDTL
jgi:hypothetical protein